MINYQISSLQKERNYIINHDMSILELSNQMEKHVLDMETSQRGYIITGKEDYLSPYKEAETKWKDEYNQLYNLLSDNPNQQKKLMTIKETIEHWIQTAGDPTVQWKRENKTQNLNNFFKTDIGHKDMDTIRTQFETFRTTEKSFTNNLAQRLDKQNSMLTLSLFGLAILLAAISISSALVVSNSIVNTINEVTQTIKQMVTSRGKIEKRIVIKSNDEIKDLGNATNTLIDVFTQRQWLQSNIAELVTMYQGISSIEKITKKFLSGISQVTGASFGALYLREQNDQMIKYVKKAIYADPEDDIGIKSFTLGQGLIGQCAAEKSIMINNNIPNDYRLISSALGEIKPNSILIAPIIFEGETIAVIELASLNEFTDLQQILMEEVLNTFGLTLNSVLGRMEIERLLKESQAMTEELQAQAEELQTQSEELNMQSEELRMINEQLEERTQEAEERARELEYAKAELEEKARQLALSSKYKSEFMANMSHELRTPLNSILLLSEMLTENSDHTLTEETVEYARVIHSSGKDLLMLINDILDLSKVEAGKLEMTFAEMSLNELPSQLEANFSPIAKQKELDFTITKEANVPDIFYTDEQRFQQIVKNLLSNALKFTESGSVSLIIRKVEDKLAQRWFQMKEAEYWLEISVQDTGIGIPKDKQTLVFEAFQQANGATERKYGGTGLGLSICKEFAKLLGGRIVLKSEEGVGSTFTLYLPSLPNGIHHVKETDTYEEIAATIQYEDEMAMEEEINEVENAHSRIVTLENNVFSNKNVLIVDDDKRNIFTLEKAIKKEGMNVFTANNGIECLKILEEHPNFDIVLMDIMMPEMDGYETMKNIRKIKKFESLPIIALTAKAMKNDREKCLEAGASDYISKPVELTQLLSAMRVWLTR